MPCNLCNFDFGFQTERGETFFIFFFFSLKQWEAICFFVSGKSFNSYEPWGAQEVGVIRHVRLPACEMLSVFVCRSSPPGMRPGKQSASGSCGWSVERLHSSEEQGAKADVSTPVTVGKGALVFPLCRQRRLGRLSRRCPPILRASIK